LSPVAEEPVAYKVLVLAVGLQALDSSCMDKNPSSLYIKADGQHSTTTSGRECFLVYLSVKIDVKIDHNVTKLILEEKGLAVNVSGGGGGLKR
jgi:hypothetical protein